MLANGHSEAQHYPVGMVYDECRIVVARRNAELVTETILLQHAVSALLSKKGQSVFKETLKKLKTED